MNEKSRSLLMQLSSLLIFGLGTLFSFQNCGSNDSTSDAPSSFTGGTNNNFSSAPYPYDISFNQIAFMSCSQTTGGGGTVMPDDLDNPFFTFRAGAYDNRVLAQRYPAIFTTKFADPELTYRLKAGVGLNANYVNYVKSTFAGRLSTSSDPNTLKTLMRDGLASSNHNDQPLTGSIFRQRSNAAFTWADFTNGRLSLSSLSATGVANLLVNGLDLGSTWGFERQNYFPGAGDVGQRALEASLMDIKAEDQRDQLLNNLPSFQLMAGFVPAGSDGTVFEYETPGDRNKQLYGRAYRLTMTRNWNGRVDYLPDGATPPNQVAHPATSIRYDLIDSVQEVDLSTTAETDLTAKESQVWDCFSLIIVRDMDRRDAVSGKYFDPDYDLNLWTPQPNPTKKNKFYDYQPTPQAPIIPGVRIACPPQELGDGSKPGTLNYSQDGGRARLRLEVARRFLPAEYWELNTNPEYMCAVPRNTVRGVGTCYQSGDFDPSQYIFYTQSGVEGGVNVSCGINPNNGQLQKECPAFVSLCYRRE
ncbi:MAG: hypothetical protein C5B49_14295 [Bdellovibrio sp.]|nr:MAG: hypothetical protein C5B49_14295 [Bdellovibrio sp.]